MHNLQDIASAAAVVHILIIWWAVSTLSSIASATNRIASTLERRDARQAMRYELAELERREARERGLNSPDARD